MVEYFPFLEEIFPQERIPAAAPASGDRLRVHILDVGQADCILIQGPEKTMVIDGGESKNGPDIIRYLRDQGVERIDFYLNTHPHADHYGGIVQVMEAIPTGEFFHHPPPEAYTPTTRGYQKLLQYLIDSKTKTTILNPGDTIDLGGGAVLTCLAPLEEYDDMNNNSLVERLVYGERAILFTGDAEKKSESAILESGAELSADVYSVPHHGSSTSTSTGVRHRLGGEGQRLRPPPPGNAGTAAAKKGYLPADRPFGEHRHRDRRGKPDRQHRPGPGGAERQRDLRPGAVMKEGSSC